MILNKPFKLSNREVSKASRLTSRVSRDGLPTPEVPGRLAKYYGKKLRGLLEAYFGWRAPGARTSGAARTRLIDDWVREAVQAAAKTAPCGERRARTSVIRGKAGRVTYHTGERRTVSRSPQAPRAWLLGKSSHNSTSKVLVHSGGGNARTTDRALDHEGCQVVRQEGNSPSHQQKEGSKGPKLETHR
jgi:hypothetical protein